MRKFLLGVFTGIFLFTMATNFSPLQSFLASTGFQKNITSDSYPFQFIINGQDIKESPLPTEQTPSNNDPSTPQNESDSKNIVGIYGISIGDNVESVLASLGEPDRKDPSAYGFTWWIYNQDYMNYLQVGVKNHQVVTLYSNAMSWSYKGIKVGLLLDDVKRIVRLQNSATFIYDQAEFKLTVTSSNVNRKFLVIENGIALEIYIDIHHNHTVTAIRISDLATLLAIGGYSMEWTYYRTPPNFKPSPLAPNEQLAVDRANERQIFDLTNTARVRRGLDPLQWHDSLASVALGHSNDMRDNKFFDHVSPTHGKLADRVKKAGIPYRIIAENIAAGQSDAIEAHEAWMNSHGHRVNILNPDLVSLGVGAIDKHYTQNFLRP